MVAFIVTENDENTGGVVFADSAVAARRYGAEEFNGGEFGGMSVRRAPWADRYGKASKVPARELIDRGWWFECSGCGATINTGFLYDERLPLSGVIGSCANGDRVYCCGRCYWREQRRRDRERKRQADVIADFRDRVRRRFGHVEFADHGEHAYCPEGQRGLWHVQQVVVAFRFPGMKIAPAVLRFEQRQYWRNEIGPPAPYYSCANGDLDVFEAWAKETKRP